MYLCYDILRTIHDDLYSIPAKKCITPSWEYIRQTQIEGYSTNKLVFFKCQGYERQGKTKECHRSAETKETHS